MPSPDSEEATLLELLDTDLDDFFFGVRIITETEVIYYTDMKLRSKMQRGSSHP